MQLCTSNYTINIASELMISESPKLVKHILFDGKNDCSITVKGYSMWPLYTNGTTVVVTQSKHSLKKGQCYLFIYKNQLLLHRLINIIKNNAFFIGDYSQKVEIVQLNAIIGEAKYQQNWRILFLFRLINWIYIKENKVRFKKERFRNKLNSLLYKLDSKNEKTLRKTKN